MPLEEYRRKRDFGRTPEPAPDEVVERSGRFTVQRHRATALHYDFRLEIDGVLVSWAVPKGPTLDPKVRRLAMRTEDHPIEYLDFEGVIPAKEYGGGDVIVWDWGTWEPEPGEPAPGIGLRKGEVKFILRGQRLHGRYTIVRTDSDDGRERWLHAEEEGRGRDRRLGCRGPSREREVRAARTTRFATASRRGSPPTRRDRRARSISPRPARPRCPTSSSR